MITINDEDEDDDDDDDADDEVGNESGYHKVLANRYFPCNK